MRGGGGRRGCCCCCCYCVGALSAEEEGLHANAPLERPLSLLPLQSPNPQVLVDWPHVLHLLGHIYNKQL